MKQWAKRTFRFLKRKKKSYIEKPVLVYQMGKVASSSIFHSLRQTPGVNVFHLHRLSPENINRVRRKHIARGIPPQDEGMALDLYERVIKPKRVARIISLVRDPISRNISAYFQNLATFENCDKAHERLNTADLINNFITKYDHEVPLRWFDLEIKSTLGIDVYDYPFPRELGYQTISQGPYQLLLMRYDLDDRLKTDLIKNFLQLDRFSLIRDNVGKNKQYGDSYREFLDAIRLPDNYVQHMLQSRYARHFYSDIELDQIESHWTRAQRECSTG